MLWLFSLLFRSIKPGQILVNLTTLQQLQGLLERGTMSKNTSTSLSDAHEQLLAITAGFWHSRAPAVAYHGPQESDFGRPGGHFLSRMTPELLDAVLRLLRLLGKPETVLCWRPCCSGEILYRLWRGQQGGQLERMAQSDGNASSVVKAVIWLKENFDKPFSIKLIAEETNMSPSGEYAAMQRRALATPWSWRDCSPSQVPRSLRALRTDEQASEGTGSCGPDRGHP
jgi:hypothetical protein